MTIFTDTQLPLNGPHSQSQKFVRPSRFLLTWSPHCKTALDSNTQTLWKPAPFHRTARVYKPKPIRKLPHFKIHLYREHNTETGNSLLCARSHPQSHLRQKQANNRDKGKLKYSLDSVIKMCPILYLKVSYLPK